ncbi:MAG: DUF2950 family protein [Planctomycetota bacterium]|nr:DUF2950 family protein [Planctomycetota bacterium]
MTKRILAVLVVVSLMGCGGGTGGSSREDMAKNQTLAAGCCKAFIEGEEIYHQNDFDGDGVHKYAQSLAELHEPTPGAQGALNLVSKAFALAEWNPTEFEATPFHGYFYRVLKAQGAHAKDGSRQYVVNGNMKLGYALVAYPAKYNSTGRDTFIINNNGMIFQADLGPETDAIAEQMTEFDPDPKKWAPAE